MTENGHPIDENPLTPTPEPMPETPVNKTKTEVVAEITHQLEAGEQKTASLATSSGRSEWSVRRTLAEMVSDGKVCLVKKGCIV